MIKEQKLIDKLLKQRFNYNRTRKILKKYRKILPKCQTLLIVEKNFDYAEFTNNKYTKAKLINCSTLLPVESEVCVVFDGAYPFIYHATITTKYKNGNIIVEL